MRTQGVDIGTRLEERRRLGRVRPVPMPGGATRLSVGRFVPSCGRFGIALRKRGFRCGRRYRQTGGAPRPALRQTVARRTVARRTVVRRTAARCTVVRCGRRLGRDTRRGARPALRQTTTRGPGRRRGGSRSGRDRLRATRRQDRCRTGLTPGQVGQRRGLALRCGTGLTLRQTGSGAGPALRQPRSGTGLTLWQTCGRLRGDGCRLSLRQCGCRLPLRQCGCRLPLRQCRCRLPLRQCRCRRRSAFRRGRDCDIAGWPRREGLGRTAVLPRARLRPGLRQGERRDEEHVGNVDAGGDARVARGVERRAQPHGEAVSGREARDHEQTHVTGGVGTDLAAESETLVDRVEFLGRDTDTAVGDLDEQTTVDGAREAERHGAVRRRRPQRVVDELGEQMHDVRGDCTAEGAFGRRADLDPLVVLDLGHRGTEDVTELHGCGMTAPHPGSGENQQVVAVTAHARRQVVEPEQALEPGRILLLVLEPFDEAELLLDERLAAPGEGFEHVVDLQAEVGLLAGEAQSLPVHVVDGAGELADLLGRVHRDPGELDVLDVVAHLDAVDRVGEFLPGDLERAVTQAPDRADERPRHQERQDQGGEQGAEHDRGVTQSGGAGVGGAGENGAADRVGCFVDEGAVDLDTLQQRRTQVQDGQGAGARGVDHRGALGDAAAQLLDLRIGRRVRPGERLEHGQLGSGRGHQRGTGLVGVPQDRHDAHHLVEEVTLGRPGIDEAGALGEHGRILDRLDDGFDDADQILTDGVGLLVELGKRDVPGRDAVSQRLGGGHRAGEVRGDDRIQLRIPGHRPDAFERRVEILDLVRDAGPGSQRRGGGTEGGTEIDEVGHDGHLVGSGREVDRVGELLLHAQSAQDHGHGHGNGENGGHLPAKAPPFDVPPPLPRWRFVTHLSSSLSTRFPPPTHTRATPLGVEEVRLRVEWSEETFLSARTISARVRITKGARSLPEPAAVVSRSGRRAENSTDQ
ncbi:hypothetical protein RHRU231_590014 [Rhodococcus ruber]|uniref:Uncharacterized protein n=1 Tax=Rhodococcus ruber TaxID=1830 RepID=A0A098BNU5_9NOCA|nr:hypothetical protein RHRU231_590014 [Rhodococcus ruber]